MPLDVGTFDNVGTRGLLFYITKLNSDNIHASFPGGSENSTLTNGVMRTLSSGV